MLSTSPWFTVRDFFRALRPVRDRHILREEVLLAPTAPARVHAPVRVRAEAERAAA